ncbi:MAG: hypothetical protein AAGH79_14340 [Bacteroidota bacterium]
MRFTYLFVVAAFLLTTSCQKEAVNDTITAADLPVFEGRSLVVSVVSNSTHCSLCNHSSSETTEQPVQDARVAIYDPGTFKEGDALPLASFDTNSSGAARFDDLNLESYQVVVIYGGNEYLGFSDTPDNKVSRVTIKLD